MENKGFEHGKLSDDDEPSFSSYCCSLAETAARVSMEYCLDYNNDDVFEFDLLPKSDNSSVFPVFNRRDILLADMSQQEHVEKAVTKKDDDHDDATTGSLLRPWTFKSLLRRSSSSQCEAPRRTNNNNNNKADEEEKVLVKERKNISSKSSIAGSDGSNNRVFPVLDCQVALQEKNQHDHVEVMKKTDNDSSEIDKPEGEKYKKSKSMGALSRRWSFKGLLRRSSSERVASPPSTNHTEEGKENCFKLLRSMSTSSSSRSSSASKKEGGEKLGSDGCIRHMCPCLSSLPVDPLQGMKEADHHKEEKVKLEKVVTCSDGSKHKNNSAALSNVDNIRKRPKLANNVHKAYLSKKSKSRHASSSYQQRNIGFFAMFRPLTIFCTSSASA